MRGRIKQGEKSRIKVGVRSLISETLRGKVPRKSMTMVKTVAQAVLDKELGKLVIERRRMQRKPRTLRANKAGRKANAITKRAHAS